MIGYFTYDQAYILVVFMVAALAMQQVKYHQAICYTLVMCAVFIRSGPDFWLLSTGSLFMVILAGLGALMRSPR